MGQFSHHQINTDRVPSLERQNDVEDGQRTRGGFSLSHGIILKAFRLVPSGVHPGHPVIRLGQNGLDLLVPVAGQDGAEEITSIYRCSENT